MSKYWDISVPLSYGALFNWIVGPRGCGKTFGFKVWAIRDFLKTGAEFVYLRRFKTEFEKPDFKKFFEDVEKLELFPGHTFELSSSNEFLIDGKYAGGCRSLTGSLVDKGPVTYPNVNKICFDEFIIDTTKDRSHHYLRNDVEAFLDQYMSIDRYRGTRVFFLSNAISVANPYFDYFNLRLPYGSKDIIRIGDDHIVQYVHNEEFEEYVNSTRIGKLLAGTGYGDFALHNKFLRDSEAFIAKKTASSKYYFTLRYNGMAYGVYTDYLEGVMTVSLDVDPSCLYIYALTNDDHEPNTLMLRNARKSSHLRLLRDSYQAGAVRFESASIKAAMIRAIAML